MPYAYLYGTGHNMIPTYSFCLSISLPTLSKLINNPKSLNLLSLSLNFLQGAPAGKIMKLVPYTCP